MGILRKEISPKSRRGFLIGAVLAGMCCGAMAQDIAGGDGNIWTDVPGATGMTISGPKGFFVEVDGSSYYGSLPKGSYRYEIYGPVAVSSDSYDSKKNFNNGRSEQAIAKRSSEGTGVIASGHFNIKSGAVFVPGNEKEKK